jgi:hypothetical protein
MVADGELLVDVLAEVFFTVEAEALAEGDVLLEFSADGVAETAADGVAVEAASTPQPVSTSINGRSIHFLDNLLAIGLSSFFFVRNPIVSAEIEERFV